MEFYSVRPISTSLPIRTEPRSFPEHWPMPLELGRRSSRFPYWRAFELLDERRGILVPFHDPEAIADKTMSLLENEAERHAMRKRAYLYSRNMVWKSVAQDYMHGFQRARAERMSNPGLVSPNAKANSHSDLPAVKLDHLGRMTDEHGIFQHAVFIIPNQHEGYTTDDNARALLVSILAEQRGVEDGANTKQVSSRYLAFLWLAFNSANGRSRNFLSYERQWQRVTGIRRQSRTRTVGPRNRSRSEGR